MRSRSRGESFQTTPALVPVAGKRGKRAHGVAGRAHSVVRRRSIDTPLLYDEYQQFPPKKYHKFI